MSDWQTGDLALCVKLGPWATFAGPAGNPDTDPTPGSIHCVSFVGQEQGHTMLYFDEFEDAWYTAHRFRKIAPHAPDAEDYVTITLLNAHPVPVEV